MAGFQRQPAGKYRSMHCEEIHGKKSFFLNNLQTINYIIGMKTVFKITFEPVIFSDSGFLGCDTM